MDADWDLHAVVRGCCSAVPSSDAAATTATTPSTPIHGFNQQKSTSYGEDSNIGILTFIPDLCQPRNDLYNFNYNPFQFPNLQKPPPPPPSPATPQRFQISPISFLGRCQDPPYQKEKGFYVKQQSLGVSRCTTAHAQGTTKIKKRKNQIKRVCQVPADGSSPDLWSWRKYGQKPIKGSPYPRGYYRCSTLKGCSARKQVERNRSDPGMLIITYTGEHTHPVPTQVNSLAGSTRNKTTTAAAAGDDDSGNKPTPSPTVSPATSLPTVTEKMDETETDDDNNFDVAGGVIDEDTFDGLDEIVSAPVIGDMFSDHHTPSCRVIWPP